MERWYLVQSKVRQEHRALTNLEGQHLEAFLPTLTLDRLRRGRRVSVNEPMFPGYLFVRFDPQFFCLSSINATRGVLRVVRYGTTLASVPEEVVEAIATRCAPGPDPELSSRIQTMPRAGDRVEILEGPFAGLTAIFAESSGERRALLLVEFLGKMQRLEVDHGEIRLVH